MSGDNKKKLRKTIKLWQRLLDIIANKEFELNSGTTCSNVLIYKYMYLNIIYKQFKFHVINTGKLQKSPRDNALAT